MNSIELLVGVVLPYVAVAGFTVGVLLRIRAWSRAPKGAPMTLYPTRGWGFGTALEEVLLLSTLRRADTVLWLPAWTFHVALGLAFLGHFRVVTGALDALLGAAGVGPAAAATLYHWAGGAAGVGLLAAGTALLVRRLLLARAREISSGPDYLALLLLLAVITSGNALRFGGDPVDLGATRAWAVSLLTLSPVVPRSPAFLLHAGLGELAILYVAYSKLLHFGGFFFTLPLLRGPQIRRRLLERSST